MLTKSARVFVHGTGSVCSRPVGQSYNFLYRPNVVAHASFHRESAANCLMDAGEVVVHTGRTSKLNQVPKATMLESSGLESSDLDPRALCHRSEERRVGKECRWRWSPNQ